MPKWHIKQTAVEIYFPHYVQLARVIIDTQPYTSDCRHVSSLSCLAFLQDSAGEPTLG